MQKTFEIEAPPERVWSIIADPMSLPKLAPNVTKVEAEPPGLATTGQKIHGIGKISGRRIEFFLETVEAVPNKTIKSRQRPGGMFEKWDSTIQLEATEKGTKANQIVNYTLAMGILGKALGKLLVERTARKNFDTYWKNAKNLAELRVK